MASVGEIKIEVKVRARAFAESAGPIIEAFARAAAPMAAAFADVAKGAAAVTQAFAHRLKPIDRRAPAQPCAWCPDGAKLPATHMTKWRKAVTFEDELTTAPPVTWEPGRRLRMCVFHAQIAERYDGVKVYRFRRIG